MKKNKLFLIFTLLGIGCLFLTSGPPFRWLQNQSILELFNRLQAPTPPLEQNSIRPITLQLLVEQNVNEALNLANRAYVLENGRITMEGAGKDLLNNDHVREAYLGI